MKLVVASNLEADVAALFRLPLAEFTGARNALAVRLKKSGRAAEAADVKALVKPSISAWAVNQLYWNHRAAFERLIASGERFHKAQTSGKITDMRAAIDARRESLAQLSDIAASVMRAAGHNPSPDTIQRITTTLQGISAYAQRADAPQPGRLAQDVDPPGFELFGASSPGAGRGRQEGGAGRQTGGTTPRPARLEPSQKSQTRRTTSAEDEARQVEETRKAKLAAARVLLQEAKRSLSEARARAKSLEADQKRAGTAAKKAESLKRDAEESLEKAEAALKDATRRARNVAAEADEALKEVRDAEREVAEASRELEKLFGE